jgi:tripartite-type tricarboxylate transporter receptor subunit TctC
VNRLHLVALRLPTALASAAFIATPSLAQEFPVKTVRIVTATAAGGSSDILARLFAGKLTEHYKPHTVIVENRASATGVLAGEMVANAAPDGHTLLLAYHQHTINAALGVPMPYHPVTNFTAITQLAAAGLLLVTHPSAPPRTLQEFVEWTRKNPGLSFGSAGIGSGGHLAGELYKLMAGTKAEHIPYKGTGQALADLMGNQYNYNFSGLQAAVRLARDGKLRALAVTNPKRVDFLADIPAVSEAIPGFDVVGWLGIIGPARIPDGIVRRLHGDINKVLASQDVQKTILNDGSLPTGSTPDEFRAFLQSDLAKWTRVVKESGMKVQ